MKNLLRKIAIALATGGGSGYLPIAPGSWGSAAAALIGWWLLGWPWIWYIVAIVCIFFLGVWCAGIADTFFSQKTKTLHDNKWIVIDEWVGTLITLLPLYYFGASWLTVAAGFFFFRAFDTAKFGLAKYFDRQPSRWGVMLDDVFAGLHAAVFYSIGLWILGQYSFFSALLGIQI